MSHVAGSSPQLEPLSHPPSSTVNPLPSPFEIKQSWMYSEWDTKAFWREIIQDKFPERKTLHPGYPNPNKKHISDLFDKIRGKGVLWEKEREAGIWEKLTVATLDPKWVLDNVHSNFFPKDQNSYVESFSFELENL